MTRDQWAHWVKCCDALDAWRNGFLTSGTVYRCTLSWPRFEMAPTLRQMPAIGQ